MKATRAGGRPKIAAVSGLCVADRRPDDHKTGRVSFIAAIDQGTTSSRCIVFDSDGRIVAADQREHRQIFPKPGWVEHDPMEIWDNVRSCVQNALQRAGIGKDDLAAIGITNQRETTVLWDRRTGQPVHNAIVWQDTRTDALVTELGGATAWTGSGPTPDFRSPPTSRARRCDGCSTPIRPCAGGPRRARSCSAPWTRG